jgi:hypothetical protein
LCNISHAQAVFDEEICHRVKSIEESRLNELDRRVTAVLLRRQSSLRQASRQGHHNNADNRVALQTSDAEPLLLEDLSSQERERVEGILAKYREGFVKRIDSKKVTGPVFFRFGVSFLCVELRVS